MKHYTIAACFSSFVLPHVLFVQDFHERKKAVMICCLGWNIGLCLDATQRERQIDMVWRMLRAYNRKALSLALEQEFKRDLRFLAAQKRDLFPWLVNLISMAELDQRNNRDVLCIKTNRSVEEIEIITGLDPAELPHVIEVLRGRHQDTAAQVDLMHQARRIPGALSDIKMTQMTTAYCVQRADLIGYHRMLTAWRDPQGTPGVQRLIRHWLRMLDEIEENSKVVLDILTEEPHAAEY